MFIFSEDNKEIDLENFILDNPSRLQGGNCYYSKILYNNKPFLIQVPKCNTKN